MCPVIMPCTPKNPLDLKASSAHQYMSTRPEEHIIFGKHYNPPYSKVLEATSLGFEALFRIREIKAEL